MRKEIAIQAFPELQTYFSIGYRNKKGYDDPVYPVNSFSTQTFEWRTKNTLLQFIAEVARNSRNSLSFPCSEKSLSIPGLWPLCNTTFCYTKNNNKHSSQCRVPNAVYSKLRVSLYYSVIFMILWTVIWILVLIFSFHLVFIVSVCLSVCLSVTVSCVLPVWRINFIIITIIELSLWQYQVCTPCSNKNRTPVIRSNNSNKSSPILIISGMHSFHLIYNYWYLLLCNVLKQRTSKEPANQQKVWQTKLKLLNQEA